jgi:phage gp36-like protein
MPGGSYASNGQQYALASDLTGTIAAAALAHPSTNLAAQNAQLLRASEFMDGYFKDQYLLPLQTWGADVVDKCCEIAAYRLVRLRGFNPEADGSYLTDYKMAIEWLESVAKGTISPDIVDATPSPAPGTQTPAAAPSSYSPNCHTRGTRRR